MLSNRVFEQRIYNYFSSKLETKTKKIASYNFKDNKEYKTENISVNGKDIFAVYL